MTLLKPHLTEITLCRVEFIIDSPCVPFCTSIKLLQFMSRGCYKHILKPDLTLIKRYVSQHGHINDGVTRKVKKSGNILQSHGGTS